jgi:hypothetical protein
MEASIPSSGRVGSIEPPASAVLCLAIGGLHDRSSPGIDCGQQVSE